MALSDIYDKVDKYKNMEHHDMYYKLLEFYSKSKVEYVMYDLFNYDHTLIDEREKEK